MADVATLKLRVDAREAKSAAGDLDKLGRASRTAEKEAASLSRAYRGLGQAIGTVAGSLIAREIIQAADGYKELNARLQLATRNSTEFAKAQAAVFDIAQRSRVGLEETGNLYTSLARSTQALGVSQDEVLGVTEAINQALIISGTSAQSAQAALVQLGQGFASGALRGEELNSVLEQAPRLAQAIADGLGVPLGRLRELGRQGELTAQRVFQALQKSAAALDSEFQRLPTTVGQATIKAANSLSRLIGVIDQATGATSGLVRAINAFKRGVDALATLPETISLGSLAKDLNDANRELKRLEALKISPFAQLVPDLEKQLAAARERLQKLRRDFRVADGRLGASSAADEFAAEARRLGLLPPTQVPDEEPGRRPRARRSTADPGFSGLTYDESIAQSVANAIESSDVLKAKELADQIAFLDKLYFEAGLSADLYDSAMARLTGTTSSAKDESSAFLERQERLAQLIAGTASAELEAQRQDMLLLAEAFETGAISLGQYLEAVEARLGLATKEIDNTAKIAAERIQGALGEELTNILEGDFENIGDAFTRVLNRMAAEAAAAQLAKAIGLDGSAGGGGLFSSIGSFFGGLFGAPGRAIGGSVSRGQMYEVNERGPEMLNVGGRQFLMMGNQSGTVTPSNGAGPTMSNTFNFSIQGPSDRRTEAQIAKAATRGLQRAQRWM